MMLEGLMALTLRSGSTPHLRTTAVISWALTTLLKPPTTRCNKNLENAIQKPRVESLQRFEDPSTALHRSEAKAAKQSLAPLVLGTRNAERDSRTPTPHHPGMFKPSEPHPEEALLKKWRFMYR